jgi:hypothetical protein
MCQDQQCFMMIKMSPSRYLNSTMLHDDKNVAFTVPQRLHGTINVSNYAFKNVMP